MRTILDFHIHSKYSRACSKDLTLPHLAVWAQKKGINILGTGDFTHPAWRAEIKEELQEGKPGLYQLKDYLTPNSPPFKERGKVNFVLTAEVSSIYKQGDKVRRVHNLLFAPSIEAVDKLVAALEKRGVNLKSDGRPIMGLHCDELVKICKDADSNIEIIPAHAWTPHFGVFGSLSGFDSIEEAFGDQAKYIFAIETGLSSDPKMNWQVREIERLALISNSDAHSLRKLGREANVFEIDPEKLSYQEIIRIIRDKDPKEFLETIEFFPEEGKYHYDGHRDCNFSCPPEQTRSLGGVCPVCGKKLLVGVMNRVSVLAHHPYGYAPRDAIPFRSSIPLEEIIAEVLGVGVASKKVTGQYEQLVATFPEFAILLEASAEQIAALSNQHIAEAVLQVRAGEVQIQPGYDGLFGQIHLYGANSRKLKSIKPEQSTLF